MTFDLLTHSFSTKYQGAERYEPVEWLSSNELLVKNRDALFVLNVITSEITPVSED
jgi:hypothetical protein